jgi:aspartyl-tRNA(Asn)/glutamyl-tRNA(Gln) amidotransferase subunit B
MYEAVIGLEIHVQINTRSKTFCGCSTGYGAPPNTNTCPVCLGLPGALPVLNREAVRKGVIAGLALNCRIVPHSVMARKNYFYPDLPKAYQISQYEHPLNTGGSLRIEPEEGEEHAGEGKIVSIVRAHLEEDAGKLVHDEDPRGPSYVDFNRCGVPLLEIVTGPDIRSPRDAVSFLHAVREIMQYTGVSECSMEKGELRVDVNISLREQGARTMGVKQEIKNLNSFAGVRRALEYEIKRQTRILRTGGTLAQETRLFNQQKNATVTMRTKEEEQDYRYFPDPDLVPIDLTEEEVDRLRSELGELPAEKRRRFREEYGLTPQDTAVLCSSPRVASYFEETVRGYRRPKHAANWIVTELMRHLNESGLDIDRYRVRPAMLRELLELIDGGTISRKMAKEVFEQMSATGRSPGRIVGEKGLRQVSDEGELAAVVDQVFTEHSQAVREILQGKEKAVGFLIGQVMRKTRGKANPALANRLVRSRLQALSS